MINKTYKRLTHEVTTDMAELVLRNVKELDGEYNPLKVYVIYRHKEKKGVLLTSFDAKSNMSLKKEGYVPIFDTSGINNHIKERPELHYKTRVEEIIYTIAKTEERNFERARREER